MVAKRMRDGCIIRHSSWRKCHLLLSKPESLREKLSGSEPEGFWPQ